MRINPVALTKCSKCGKPVVPHTVCNNCGYYKGVQVLDVLKRLDKKERKRREKEMKQHAHEERREKPLSMEALSKNDKQAE